MKALSLIKQSSLPTGGSILTGGRKTFVRNQTFQKSRYVKPVKKDGFSIQRVGTGVAIGSVPLAAYVASQ